MIRFDDLTGDRRSWTFSDPEAGGRSTSIDTVRTTIVDAESRAREHDEWVVMAIAYEAAPAFDPAMRTAPSPPEGIPFVWWRSFRARHPTDPLVPAPTRITSRERRTNRWPFPEAVELVRDRIALGDVYQVNVTDRFDGRFDGAPLDVYRALLGVQRCAYGALVDLGPRVVASASPELFFRWGHDGRIACRPMKGTAPRQPRADADEAVGAALLDSEKDRAENVMIVDLLRNDLGRIAALGSVQVPDLFTLERYETVWQLTSSVHAETRAGVTLVDVMAALFPCGSVTGAPKIAAMGIIADLEAHPRGVYCGALGFLAPPGAGPRAVFSVPIRTAVLDPATATYEYGAGAGITWSSDPAAEDAEVRAKARILTRSHREVALLETMRLDDHGLANVELHVDRLASSAGWFGFPFDRSAVVQRLRALERDVHGVERVRVVLERSGEVRVERSALDDAPTVVRLALDDAVTRSDDPFCCHKTTWRRHYDDARRRHPGADDVVLVNERGCALETTIANLAFFVEGRWWSPPLTDGGLAGIARHVAIADGRLAERSIRAAELRDCEQLAVLNDLRGWRRAVLSVDVRSRSTSGHG